MSLIDQFIASISFSTKKVLSWRKQSVWKSFFYVIVLVLATNLILSGYALYKGYQYSFYNQVKAAPSFEITKDGLDYKGDPYVIQLPQLETMIVISNDDSTHVPMQGMKNLIQLNKDTWSIGRVGFPGSVLTYDSFLSFVSETDGVFDKSDSLTWAKDMSSKLNYFAPIYQYTSIVIDLVSQLIFISLLALAGAGFRKFVKISYREAWTITAYGISAPIFVRTVFSLLGFQMSFLFLLYWTVVGFFSLRMIRSIQGEEVKE